MEIKNFEDLTSFISSEFLKMSECYGMQKPSEKFLRYVEGTLLEYPKLYKKPFNKLKKAEIKIVFAEQMMEYKVRYALVTMPHGRMWKWLHHGLWVRCQEYLKRQEEEKEVQNRMQSEVEPIPQSLVPEVVRRPSMPIED